MYRHFSQNLAPNFRQTIAFKPSLNHRRNHFSDHPENHNGDHFQNFLSTNIEWFFATWFISQMLTGHVILEAMRRPRLDPKHVRDFFYNHALSVRILTLIFDGIWWLIAKGFRRSFLWMYRVIRFYLPIRFSVDEPLQRLHTLIVGRTGAGKSILLYNIIRHYLTTYTKPTIVLFDPHGDLARAVARDKTNFHHDRLVYIRLGVQGQIQPHFNPFDLVNPTEYRLNRAQLQYSGAVEQIIGEAFTPRQRTLIRACMGIMLHRPGSSLIDLIRLLQDGQNADLVQYGQTKLPNQIDRLFFVGSFNDFHYRATKQALISRLTDIARDPIVRQFTCHRSSFDLGRALDTGRVLIFQFDPSVQGRDTVRTIGQLLNAAILSHVLGRSSSKRYPIHLFADEAQYFVSPTISEILGESRKFGLYITLATQRLEQMDTALQDAVLGNVGNIWIGGSRNFTAEKLSRETDVSAEKIRKLPNLQFIHVATNRPAKRRSLRYLGTRYLMNKKQWRATLAQQAKRYYRSKSTPENPSRNPNDQTTWNPDFL